MEHFHPDDPVAIDDYYTPISAAKSNTIGCNIATEWKFPLRTTFGVSVTSGQTQEIDTAGANSAKSAKSSAFILNATGDYAMLEKKDMRLNVYGGLGYSSVKLPSIATTSLTSITAGSRFNFFQKHTISLNLNITTGLKIPKSSGGTKSVTNSVSTARYDFVF